MDFSVPCTRNSEDKKGLDAVIQNISRNSTVRVWAVVALAIVLVGLAASIAYSNPTHATISLLTLTSITLILACGGFLHTLNRRHLADRQELGKQRELMRRLDESEKRYRTLAETFLGPVFTIQDSRVKFANKLFYTLSEYTPEDVLKEDFDVFSLVHEDDRNQAINDIAEVLSGERASRPGELRLVKKSGEQFVCLTFSSVITFEGKSAIETVAVDITRLKETEQELDRTRKRLEYLLDNAPVMIFQLDSTGNFSYANKETLRITGYKYNEWVGKSFAPIVHPDDLAMAAAKFEEARKGTERRGSTLRIKNARGEIRVLRINASTIWEGDQFGGSLLIGRDITEQRHLKEQLERDKEFIDQLIENANAMIGVTNEEGKLIVFNKRFEEVTGFTKEDALGKDPMEVYVPLESRTMTYAALKEIRKGQPIHELEVPIVSKTGEALLATWSGAAVKLPSGHNGLVVVGQDVTERKRMREELLQSKKLASIGELVSGVAHELNNPLTIVMGFSQLLATEPDATDEQRNKAQKIFDAASRSKRIVENLNAFARKKKLAKQEVDINRILEDTLSLREHSFEVNNIKLIKKYDKNLPLTYADGYQLQQVFLNLINNAFDAMYDTHQSGALEVRTSRENGEIIIEVADNGPGVPELLQEKVFDPFFTTKEVGKGTGLGMSLSYGIVKEHGGRIYLDTSYQHGARFVIQLPVTKMPVTAN